MLLKMVVETHVNCYAFYFFYLHAVDFKILFILDLAKI